MHTTMLSRLRRPAISALVLASALSLVSVSSGQTETVEEPQSIAAQIQELVAALDARRAELDELAKKVDKNLDRANAAMMQNEVSARREKYRRDVASLVKLVINGEDAGADVAQGRAAATEILEAEAPKMKATLADQKEQTLALMDTSANGTPEEADKARADLIRQISSSTRLLKYLNSNIDQRKQLGLNVDADTAHLTQWLQVRTDVGVGLLKGTKEQIDELAKRAGVEADVEAQKELVTLRKQRDALAENLRVAADLMDEHGLDTSELRQGIISTTGKLSQDILNKDVAAGLLESFAADAADWFLTNGAEIVFELLIFLLILFAFWVLSRIARGTARRLIERSKLHMSSLARDFFIKMTSRTVMLLGLFIAIAQLGVQVGPLLAGLGIAGFIVGFALQDTLSNFASGMMILVYRPFDVGDAVEAGGVVGAVHQMNLVSTMILTFDNQLLVVPNKLVWGGIIRNITHQDKRRVDMTFGIGYSDDIPKAEEVLMAIVTNHEKVLKDPEPVVRLHTLGDSSVDFIVRPWSKTKDYWDVYWDVTREVKRRFDEEGISIPFPQRDVHIHQHGGNGDGAGGSGTQRSETPTSAETPIQGGAEVG
ncbi:MAG: mechanosensitive ion channel [Deltaproteobacteria bacterium]|nr:mechanosensitive ion channel [Deltaproteobacteria bacterium]